MSPTTRAQHKRACTLSADRVFSLPELLELILLHANISPANLLRIQRVSKTFQATIQFSPNLQRKLWLRTPKGPFQNDKTNREINPFFKTRGIWVSRFGRPRLGMSRSTVEPTPGYPFAYCITSPIHNKVFIDIHQDMIFNKYEGKESWTQMRIARTKDKFVRFGIWLVDGKGQRVSYLPEMPRSIMIVEADGEVTAGDLIKLVKEKVEEWDAVEKLMSEAKLAIVVTD